ncbi:MAG: cell division protein FtsZ [Rhodospirillales bacterium]|nr:cell division protein FtsZ [Rhodospirillales bacterium]
MTLNLTVSPQLHIDFTPRITVIGVGGGGTNAVDNMIAMNLQGVEFVVANTDAQQLVHSRASRRIQLGPHLTQGLGAGAKPEIGRAAAEEAIDELDRHLEGAHMVFITAGMGGGTGTGAAPVIARMARERGILTVGVVTKPFTFEGSRRARAADAGIGELQQYVDTLIVIPNQNLFRLANERTGWKEAFKMADNVLYMGVRGVTDLMVAPGMVNLDFADIRTVMAEMGKAMMGTGEAEGENRAIRAAESAISNPLLEDTCMAGARGLLINITGGEDMTLFEVDQAANRIREEVDEEANIIFGSAIDDSLQGRIRVSVVATGIESAESRNAERPKLIAVGGGAVHAVGQPIGGGTTAGAQAVGGAPGTAAPQPTLLRPGVPAGFVAPRPPGPAARPAAGGIAPLQASPLQASPLQAAPAHAAQPMALQTPPRAPEMDIAPPQVQMQPQVQGQPAQPTPAPIYDVEFDEPPMGPRPIPAHLQQPLRPQPAKPRPAPRNGGLFADPPRADGPAPGPAPKRSLFGIVTGALRGGLPTEQAPRAEAAAQQAAQYAAQHEAPAEAPRPELRQTGGEEMGIDIPAFLRRQSS